MAVQCPRCGGWHYASGEPPKVNHTPKSPDTEKAESTLIIAILDAVEGHRSESDPYDRDVLPNGDGKLWNSRVYGTDERGEEVTVAFGIEDSNRAGHVMISDGHDPDWTFYDEDQSGVKRHDHIGPGPQPDEFRGRYSGWDEFHDQA